MRNQVLIAFLRALAVCMLMSTFLFSMYLLLWGLFFNVKVFGAILAVSLGFLTHHNYTGQIRTEVGWLGFKVGRGDGESE